MSKEQWAREIADSLCQDSDEPWYISAKAEEAALAMYDKCEGEIKAQETENKDLWFERQCNQAEIGAQNEQIAQLQSDNERLHDVCAEVQYEVARLSGENGRLQKELEAEKQRHIETANHGHSIQYKLEADNERLQKENDAMRTAFLDRDSDNYKEILSLQKRVSELEKNLDKATSLLSDSEYKYYLGESNE